MYYNLFSKRLKEAMSDIGIKQIELANRTGLDKSLISNYLADKYKPKNNNLQILAKALNVNPVWLMGYDVNKNGDEIIADIERDSMLDAHINNLAKNELEKELLIKITMLKDTNQMKLLELVNMYLKEQGDYYEQNKQGKWVQTNEK